jgi:hypothetical protein
MWQGKIGNAAYVRSLSGCAQCKENFQQAICVKTDIPTLNDNRRIQQILETVVLPQHAVVDSLSHSQNKLSSSNRNTSANQGIEEVDHFVCNPFQTLLILQGGTEYTLYVRGYKGGNR